MCVFLNYGLQKKKRKVSALYFLSWFSWYGSASKESTCQCRRWGDTVSIPGLGRSSGEGNGNPLQYSCLGNPTDGGAWRATVCNHKIVVWESWPDTTEELSIHACIDLCYSPNTSISCKMSPLWHSFCWRALLWAQLLLMWVEQHLISQLTGASSVL